MNHVPCGNFFWWSGGSQLWLHIRFIWIFFFKKNTAVQPCSRSAKSEPLGAGLKYQYFYKASWWFWRAVGFEQKWSWKGTILITCVQFRFAQWFQIFFWSVRSTASFCKNKNEHTIELKIYFITKISAENNNFILWMWICTFPPPFYFKLLKQLL